MRTKTIFIALLGMLISAKGYSQAGKDGSVTISSSTVVNEYTYLTTTASAGATSVTVANSSLNANGRFSSALSSGDLIMIIQMQGAELNGSTEPWDNPGWYGLPLDASWGQVTNYHNCGNYEFCEVKDVSGSNINVRCSIQNSYTDTGRVQVIRVPRYSALTVTGTITADPWDGTTGGIVAIENQNDITLNGTIDVSGLGFRGGVDHYTTATNNIGQFAHLCYTPDWTVYFLGGLFNGAPGCR